MDMIGRGSPVAGTPMGQGSKPIRRMPAQFGPTPGPRQTMAGGRHDLDQSPHSTGIWVQHAVDGSQVAAMLPPGFVPGAVADLVVEIRNLTQISWLAGRGYNIVTVSTSAVWTEGAEPLAGRFQLVLWENMADPIISGREELGFAKLYADIPDLDVAAEHGRGQASWDGFQFLSLEVQELRQVPIGQYSQPGGPGFHWKYLPRTQDWGEADVSYAVVTPPAGGTRRLIETHLGTGHASFRHASWEQLPTLLHVVNPLAKLDLGQCLAAGHCRSIGGKDFSDQQILGAIAE